MRKTTLISLLLAILASGLCFGMLYAMMAAIGHSQIVLCWPVYWLFVALSGLLGVAIWVMITEVGQLKNNR